LDFTRLLPGPLWHAHDEPNGCGGHKIESPTNGLYVHYRKLTGFPLFHTPITAKQLIIDYETPEGYRQIVEEIKQPMFW
jgi:hypothetical protein